MESISVGAINQMFKKVFVQDVYLLLGGVHTSVDYSPGIPESGMHVGYAYKIQRRIAGL